MFYFLVVTHSFYSTPFPDLDRFYGKGLGLLLLTSQYRPANRLSNHPPSLAVCITPLLSMLIIARDGGTWLRRFIDKLTARYLDPLLSTHPMTSHSNTALKASTASDFTIDLYSSCWLLIWMKHVRCSTSPPLPSPFPFYLLTKSLS